MAERCAAASKQNPRRRTWTHHVRPNVTEGRPAECSSRRSPARHHRRFLRARRAHFPRRSPRRDEKVRLTFLNSKTTSNNNHQAPPHYSMCARLQGDFIPGNCRMASRNWIQHLTPESPTKMCSTPSNKDMPTPTQSTRTYRRRLRRRRRGLSRITKSARWRCGWDPDKSSAQNARTFVMRIQRV